MVSLESLHVLVDENISMVRLISMWYFILSLIFAYMFMGYAYTDWAV